MAVYIFQENEPFTEISRRMAERGVSIAAQAEVRRPVRGLQVSKDTYAYLKVVDSEGRELPFINSGSMGFLPDKEGIGYSNVYSNFLLQKVQIARSELKQFVKTFGLTYLFLFGENPIMVSVEGALVHSADFPWDEEWWANYENTLRATRLAELGARVYLTYEGYLIEGYILNATTSREAMVKHMMPLGFEMVATNIKFLSKVGKVDFPIYRSQVRVSGPGALGQINQILPQDRILQFSQQNVVGLLSSGFASGSSSLVEFGSFSNMMQYFAKAPWLLAGMSAPSFELMNAAELGLQNMRLRGMKTPEPRRGAIRLNRDEYMTLPPMSNSAIETQSRGVRYQSMLEPLSDRSSFGDIISQVTEDSAYPSGNATNAETIEGLTRGTGVGCLPDKDLDIPANGVHLIRYEDSPWPGITPT